MAPSLVPRSGRSVFNTDAGPSGKAGVGPRCARADLRVRTICSRMAS